MIYRYSSHRHFLAELLFSHAPAPEEHFALEETLTPHQLTQIQDAITATRHYLERLMPYRETLSRGLLYLNHYNYVPLAFCLYQIILQTQDPQTPEALYEALRSLDGATVHQAMAHALNHDGPLTADIFLATLDEMDLSDAERWAWFQAYQAPTAYLNKLANCLALIEPILRQAIAPFAEEYQQNQYAILDQGAGAIMKQVSFVDQELINQVEAVDQPLDVYIFSPLHIYFVFDSSQRYLILPSRYALFSNGQEQLEPETYRTLLKLLSDSTTAQILHLLTTTKLKTKEIASQVGVTSAAVSYHTSKLLLHNLIHVQDERTMKTRYLLNKPLMRQIRDTLSQEFNL